MNLMVLVLDSVLLIIIAHEMMDTIDYALHIYYDDKDQWNGLIYRAMTEKLDWDRSADEYLRVFGSLLG